MTTPDNTEPCDWLDITTMSDTKHRLLCLQTGEIKEVEPQSDLSLFWCEYHQARLSECECRAKTNRSMP